MGKTRKGKSLDNSLIQWCEGSTPASQFVTQCDLPQVVKLNTGNYGNLSCGSDVDVTQPFLLHTSRPQCEKVLAQIVKWDAGRGEYVDMDTHLIIPYNYPGWFTVSDQDHAGAVKPWVSLKDIPLKETKAVLATKPLTCFVLAEDTSVGEKIYLNTDCSAGEVFELGDLYVERTTRTTPTCCMTWLTGGKTTKDTVEEVEYLLCQDAQSTDLLIPMFTKGLFYKVDRPKLSDGLCDNTVYRLCDIINYVDLPCYVQLVHGTSPRNINLSSSVIRLEEKCKEDTIIACSLHSPKFSLLEFPLDTDIQFIHTKNNMELLNQTYVQDAIQYCLNQVTPYIVSLKVIQNFAPTKSKEKRKSDKKPSRPVISGPILSDGALEKFVSQVQQHGLAFEGQGQDGDLSQSQQNGDLVSDSTDVFTDDESILQGPECHYETIPCDKRRSKGKLRHVTEMSLGISDNKERLQELDKHSVSTDPGTLEIVPRQINPEGIREDEYLVPLNLRKQSVYSNLPNIQTSQEERTQLKHNAVCQRNSFNGNDIRAWKPSVLNQLPPIGHERMDKFLQDSVEELNRSQHNSSVDHRNPSELDDVDDAIEGNMEVSGMKAKLDAFLDEIFDYDNLEKGNISNNLEQMVTQPELDRETDIVFNNLSPFNKSVSASELHENNLSPYSPDSVNSADGKIVYSTKDMDTPSKSENNSSGSRSASSIYRQMKCTHYGRAESYHADSPYHRTDSGIVISPRYSASEAGYNRDIYKAMSDMAWLPPDDLSMLSVEEVGLSLIYIGIKQKEVDHFMDQQIDGEQLTGIDESLLKEAFPDLNGLERKKIVDFVHGWRPKKIACY